MSTRPYTRRAAGLLAGYLADRVLGDPRRLHPVAGFGCTAAALEKLTYRPTRVAGAAHVCVLVGAVAFAGRLLPRHTVVVAAATWTVLGGRSLEREALAVHDLLARGDLNGARVRVRNLVGRDTSGLDAAQVARAAVESVAENGSDAVVAPLFWGALAGTPGLLAHRAINTLDAMIGHHTSRYEQFGWAAAKLDDLANWPAARVSVLCTMLVHPRRARSIVATVRRDAPAHPSPNAGPVESAYAAALGVRLGGTNSYHGAVEHRGVLGDGRAVAPDDLLRVVRLHRGVCGAALAMSVAASLGVSALRS